MSTSLASERVVAPPAASRWRRAERKGLFDWADRWIVVLFNVPTVVLLVALFAFPILVIIRTSLTDASLYAPGPAAFVGLTNYVTAWSDPRWLNSVWQTLYFAGGSVALQLVIGLGIALLLNRQLRGKSFYRSVFMLPIIAMSTAVSLVWITLFNNSYGLLNYWLGLAGIEPVSWLSDERLAIPSLILVQVWHWTPFMTLLLLSGLQSLPAEPFEAARIDGASSWQILTRITLPLLRGHIVVALMLRSIFALKEFDTILTMTEGGPNGASETINMNIYFTAFSYGYTGAAAARGVMFFLIIIGIELLILRMRRRQWAL